MQKIIVKNTNNSSAVTTTDTIFQKKSGQGKQIFSAYCRGIILVSAHRMCTNKVLCTLNNVSVSV